MASVSRNAAFVRSHLATVELRNFAFPYGHASLSAKLRTGPRFSSCRGIRPGLNEDVIEMSNLRAISLEERQKHSHDIPALVAAAALRKAWLVVFTHDIGDNPSEYGSRPRDLANLIETAKKAGLRVVPICEALSGDST